MDYFEWADEYREEALTVMKIIEKKKEMLKKKNLTADERKQINDTIITFRCIYRELLGVAEHLRSRAERISHEA